MKVVLQPWTGHVGSGLRHELESGQWADAWIFVAYAKSAGITTITAASEAFIASGGNLHVFVGVDQNGTSVEALRQLVSFVPEPWVVHNPGVTFHPKLYLFTSETAAHLIVGSSNLTPGGLYNNIEASVVVSLDLTKEDEARLVKDLIESLTSLPPQIVQRLDEGLIQDLIDEGLVLDEGAIAARSPRKALAGRPAGRFSHVPLPRPSRRVEAGLPHAEPKPKQGENFGDGDFFSGPTLFVMTLGHRDAQQLRGYSRDVYIPLVARDASPSFWLWPGGFVTPKSNAKGTFLERRIATMLHPPHGAPIQDARRLYSYKERSEFRLNAGPVLTGSAEGDIIVFEKSALPGVELEVSVIPAGSPLYARFLGIASNVAAGSHNKRWGYA
jgi:HKD family nuclease